MKRRPQRTYFMLLVPIVDEHGRRADEIHQVDGLGYVVSRRWRI